MDIAKPAALPAPAAVQFSMKTLLELTTICAIIFAASGVTGFAASGFLAMMAVFLMLRSGAWAVVMLAGAMIYGGQGVLAVVVLVSLLCLWFSVKRMRQRLQEEKVARDFSGLA